MRYPPRRSSIASYGNDRSALANQPLICVLRALFMSPINIDDAVHLPDPAGEAAFESVEAAADVARACVGLSDRELSLLHDEFYLGLPQAAIARKRGISAAAICKARRRALAKMRLVLSNGR